MGDRLRACYALNSPVTTSDPDYGCVLFEAKPVPVRRITFTRPIQGDPACVSTAVKLLNARPLPPGITHYIVVPACIALLKIEESEE